LFWRRLVTLHGKFEFDLREKMKAASTLGASTGLPNSVLERPQEWNLQIDEVTMPFASEHAGRKISDLAIRKNLGCSVMAIDRQGFLITNPTADERLFAADKLLLLGTSEQLALTEQFLRAPTGSSRRDEFEQIAMETLEVPERSPEIGKSLNDLNPVARFGIQICGIERGGARILVPSSTERLAGGDKLLLLGAHENIQGFRSHLWQD
jgi:CPA2 family monovalent cation:H+ antiporter-2